MYTERETTEALLVQEKPVVKSAPEEGGGAVSGHKKKRGGGGRETVSSALTPVAPTGQRSQDGKHGLGRRQQCLNRKDSWRDRRYNGSKLKEEPNKVLYKDPHVVRTSVSRHGSMRHHESQQRLTLPDTVRGKTTNRSSRANQHWLVNQGKTLIESGRRMIAYGRVGHGSAESRRVHSLNQGRSSWNDRDNYAVMKKMEEPKLRIPDP